MSYNRDDSRHQAGHDEAGLKLYSLHAPEVECIGKGKAYRPCEFGCKVSVTATNAQAPGGHFVLHIEALHGRPYNGHTPGDAIDKVGQWTSVVC